MVVDSASRDRWSTLKTCEAMLPELHADIICFQGAPSRVNMLNYNVGHSNQPRIDITFARNENVEERPR